jgi:hypothetical protein
MGMAGRAELCALAELAHWARARRALTRVATADNELLLLQYAQSSTGSQLERICRSFRRVTRPAGRAHDDERYVRQRHLQNGMVRIEAQVLPDEAELVMKAIQEARRAAARVPAETQTESAPETPTMVDGLVLAAESFLARGPKCRTGGERNQLFIYMTEDNVESEELVFRATLSDGTILSGPTLLRLACDSGIVVAKTDAADNLLDIGRRTRTIPPALRRALWLRDGGCRFPGCCARAYCEAHHIEHWSFGGPTSLLNTVLLCHYHHVLLHEGGFGIVRAPDGTLLFLDPDCRCIHHAPAPPSLAGDALSILSNDAIARKLIIDARTNFARYSPEPLDLHACVDALVRRTQSNPTSARHSWHCAPLDFPAAADDSIGRNAACTRECQ